MGEFTQNLLKLTEFPFSYSLIGLLALIFGQGINPENLSFTTLGPLLILMGFVATTLSICDPVGSLQREVIKGRKLGPWNTTTADRFLKGVIFGRKVLNLFQIPYIFAIRFAPDDMRITRRKEISWESMNLMVESSRDLRTSDFDVAQRVEELDKISGSHIKGVTKLVNELRQQTVKTKWITAEVDKITALIYFIITVSVFISAIIFVPDFLQKFSAPFGNIPSTKLIILIFSVMALAVVIYMFINRIYGSDGLRTKASIVFRYLTALGAVKANKEDFRTTLEDIERYLNDNHWTLAEYWVDRIQTDYSVLFLQKLIDIKNNKETPKTISGVE